MCSVLQKWQEITTIYLARDFIKLEKDIISAKQSRETWQELIARRLDIEAEEPPSLRVLNFICHNELVKAMGYGEEEEYKIYFIQRIFSHFIDIYSHSIKRKSIAQS